MESQVNPSTIAERAEKLVVAPEVKPEPVAVVTPEPVVKPEVKPDPSSSTSDPSKKSEVVVEKPIPNDPTELRKWNTKVSQENAAMREEIRSLKNAVEKMTKKPIDYKELAKNPDSLKSHIEAERAEAVAEMQDKLQTALNTAVEKETQVERIRREQDIANFPEWKRLFPVIQNLASNTDGRINFNKKPSDVLDDLYALALQLSPVQVVPVAPVAPVVPGKTAEEIQADITAAEKRGFEKAQTALRDEKNGAGVGGLGKGGRRSSGLEKDALQNMPLKDLKKLISQE